MTSYKERLNKLTFFKVKMGLLFLFFVVHLILIFFQASWSMVDLYSKIKLEKKIHIPVLSSLKINKHNELYYMLTGTNTGYGFYGIQTATEKYFNVTYYDVNKQKIKSDRYFNFSTSNGISRFKGQATYISNYISETEKMEEKKSIGKSAAYERLIHFRKDYVQKLFKWLGKKEAESLENCDSYKVELMTIVPQDIWTNPEDNKPKLYVVKEVDFLVE